MNRIVIVLSFLIVASCLLSSAVRAQTYVCGDICNQTWTPAGSPYIATCAVRVLDTSDPSCFLTITAGTEVRFQSGGRLAIYADDSLQVLGTAADPVIFTSDSATPSPGSWNDIYFVNGSTGFFQHAEIRYAKVGIQTYGDSLIVEDSTIEHCSLHAIYVRATPTTITNVTMQNNDQGLRVQAGNDLSVTGSTFTQNGIGMYLGGGGTVTVRDSAIHDNTSWDLFGNGNAGTYPAVIDARQNWWGDTDPNVIRDHIYDHASYESGRPIVDWCEWLDGPSGTPDATYECPDLVICDEIDVWNVTSRPYLLGSEVFVCPTGRLEVGPGVEVRAAATIQTHNINIKVDGGQVDVDASTGPPAVFTTNNPSPGPDDWDGFRVYSISGTSPSVVMRNATIQYGEYGIEAYDNAVIDLDDVLIHDNEVDGISVREDTQLTLVNVTLQNNRRDGLRVAGNVPVSASGCTITGNTGRGVYIAGYTAGSGAFAFNGSSIHDNGSSYEVTAQGGANPDSTVLDFRGNWWGTDLTDDIRPTIYDHARTTGPIVDWCGFLDDAPPLGVPARDVECPGLVVCSGTDRWDVTTRPYLMVSDVYVCPAARLEIGPGVEVRATKLSTVKFLVDGELDVDGTPASPVALTSDASVPARNDWYGLRLRNNSRAWMRNATLQWTSNGIYATNTSEMTLENSAIIDAQWDGIELLDSTVANLANVVISRNQRGIYGNGDPTLRATGCSITGNEGAGIQIEGANVFSPSVVITGSTLHSNASYDILARYYAGGANDILWAPDNWWGTTDIEAVRDAIYDHEDVASGPRVHFRPFSLQCDRAFGGDVDSDGYGDFEDTCPAMDNVDQADADFDGMGDPCDPAPGALPTGDCDGVNDVADGYADSDSDGYGDPCDHQPTRDDSYPGATELCDARDNDGDPTTWATDELSDLDFDENIDCADCDTADPLIHACYCENCTNLIDDNCDNLVDGADPSCVESDTCVILVDGVPEPTITLERGPCGGASVGVLYDVIRGDLGQCGFDGGSVDLGAVACVANDLAWDRVTDTSADPNADCDSVPVVFYLAMKTTDSDYGAATGGQRRDVMSGMPCP